jgi:hypothetical protein
MAMEANNTTSHKEDSTPPSVGGACARHVAPRTSKAGVKRERRVSPARPSRV